MEPRVDDPALPAPSGGATRRGGAGGLRETAASTAPGNTRPDEDVGRVGPRQLDAATSQAPMEEEPDWSCDNQSEDGCLPSHAPRSHTPRSLCSATTLAQGLGFDSRWWGPSHSNLSHGAVPPRGFSRGFCPGFFFPRLLPRGSSQQQHQLQIKNKEDQCTDYTIANWFFNLNSN